ATGSATSAACCTTPSPPCGRTAERTMSMLITGIEELVTGDPEAEGAITDPLHAGLGVLRDAAIVIGGGGEDSAPTVQWVGHAAAAPAADWAIDLEGRSVVPGFVDSHSHLVFAGDRSAEFAARMSGTPYDGGGIATTVEATRSASDPELRTLLQHRVQEMRAQGTTTVEVKSGYGLTVEDEVRALRLAREVTTEVTYLGA